MTPRDFPVSPRRAALAALFLFGLAPAAGLDPLAYGFRFASAIASDEKDRGKAQEAVVLDYALLGNLDEAIRLADSVEGWRRAAVYAQLASRLAGAGRMDESRALLARAEEIRSSVEGWPGPRIASYAVEAHAARGEMDQAGKIATELTEADARQYAGRSAAALAAGKARQGDYAGAAAALDRLAGDDDMDVSWWRAAGYLALGKEPALTREQRRQALDAARRAADAIPGWRKAEALQSVARAYHQLGADAPAGDALRAAEAIVRPLPETIPVNVPLLSNLARTWAEIGEKGRGRDLLKLAEARVPSAIDIDRPGILANLGASRAALGETKESARLYQRALDAAGALVNARPRALAAVEICRSLGRQEIPLDDRTRGRLDILLAGLKDPW